MSKDNEAPKPVRRMVVEFDADGTWRLHLDPSPALVEFELGIYCIAMLKHVVTALETPAAPVVSSEGVAEGVADVCED